MSVLRFDLVPAADEPELILAVVGRVAAGQRDAEAIAADLDRPIEQVRPALDAAAWLGLVWAGAEPSLTARGLELAGAPHRQQTRLYAEAIWRQPLARTLLRGHGSPDLPLALRVLREAAPGAPEVRLQRQARCLLALCLPALTHAPRRAASGGEQVTLPLATPGRPPEASDDGPTGVLAEALLDHGELSPRHLPALLARAGHTDAPIARIIDELLHSGRARRDGDQLVAAAAPAVRGDEPCLDRLAAGGLALAFPSSLAELNTGVPALNQALRQADPEAPRLPSPTDARRVVHGGLMTPGERALRAVPDALSLRLRALASAPAFALLGAALLLDRRANGDLAVERAHAGRKAGPTLRWRRTEPLPLLDGLGAFASALGHVVLRPQRGGLDDATLANTAVSLGLAAWTGSRLRLDEQLFTRLQRDAEAGLLLDALEPLSARLANWLEARAPRKRPAPGGERVFVYGSLLNGQRHAARLAELPREPATARGRLWLLHESYPALVPAPRGPVVHGELVEGISETLLAELDAFEELDRGLYRRARVRVRVGARSAEAWAYVQDEDTLRAAGCAPLELDDWRRRPPGLAPG